MKIRFLFLSALLFSLLSSSLSASTCRPRTMATMRPKVCKPMLSSCLPKATVLAGVIITTALTIILQNNASHSSGFDTSIPG